MFLSVGFLSLMPIVHAQYGSSNTTTTPEQFDECKRLGIEPDQCSDATILAKLGRCLGPNCGTGTPPPKLDPVSLSIMIGSGMAFVIGVLAVKKIRKVRKRA